MRSLPTVLLIVSFPVGLVVYTLAAQVITMLLPNDGTRAFIVLVVPLFVAGLAMMPFLIPFFDRKARQDLAEHARSRAQEASGDETDSQDGQTKD